MAGFMDWLTGTEGGYKKVATGTKQQQQLHNQVLQQAMQMSQGGYQNAQDYYNNILQPGSNAYSNFAAPYMQQFEEQILPGIAERFAGGGALSSSGFGQALGGAASGLQSQLAQLFSQLQQQAAGAQTNQYNQLTQTGLNYQPFAYQQQEGTTGFLPNLLAGIGGAAAGPLGAGIGNGIGNLFKQPGPGGGMGARGANAVGYGGLS
jgi:hypothetical protein